MTEEAKTNGINLFVSNNHITINADITFAVEEQGEVTEVHLSDVLYQLVLLKLKEHDTAKLSPGSYKISLTSVCSATAPPPSNSVDAQANTLVEKMLGNEIPDSEDK